MMQSLERMCTRKKDVEGLGCGFVDIVSLTAHET